MRILIVEDEVRLAEAIEQIMKSQKYITDIAHNGEDGLHYALNGSYDIIILDVMLPKLSGFEIVKELRDKKYTTPILMLTAKDEINDKVLGLDQGADDYMTKPFYQDELLARVRALSRRKGELILNQINFEDLMLNLSANTLNCNEKSVHLSFKEFEIMRILILSKTFITPKEDLIIKVWGMDSDAEDNNVEVYISFLRKKLFFLNSCVSIETIRKVGYKLEKKND